MICGGGVAAPTGQRWVTCEFGVHSLAGRTNKHLTKYRLSPARRETFGEMTMVLKTTKKQREKIRRRAVAASERFPESTSSRIAANVTLSVYEVTALLDDIETLVCMIKMKK